MITSGFRLRKIRGLEIRIKRKAGRSLCDARLDADALIARVQKALASNQPPGRRPVTDLGHEPLKYETRT